MSWFHLILICVLFTSIANLLRRVLMKNDKSDPISYSVIFHFLITFFNFFFVLFVGFEFPKISFDLIFFLAAAITWGACSIFVFKALQLIEASEVTIVSSTRVIITIAGAMLFLGESFTLQKLIGTGIILVSVILVADLKKGFKFNKGLMYTLIMAFLAGLGVVIDAYNVRNYDPVSYNLVINFMIGTLLLIYYPKTLRQLPGFTKPSFIKAMLPLGFFTSIQAIAYYLALGSGGNASQIGPILQAQVIVTVLLAIIFLKERDFIYRKIIASILVTIGVLLIR
jgi:bacterial/archaeal transporter family protein